MDVILIRPAELFLKKKNRREFEWQLIRNLRVLLGSEQILQIKILNSIFVLTLVAGDNLLHNAQKIARYLIGCANVSVGFMTEKKIDNIAQTVLTLDKLLPESDLIIKSFRITVHRHHKSDFYNSQKIAQLIGREVVQKTKKQVNLTGYDYDVRIEVFLSFVVVCDSTMKGPGGLPVGTSGRTIHLISAGFDSPVASFLLQKRGMSVDYIHFHNGDTTGIEIIQKVKMQIKNLKQYQQRHKINMILVNVQLLFNEIICSAPPKYQLLILKYFFIYISSHFQRAGHYDTISTGESLGQVSTQTISNLNFLYRQFHGLPLTPLIGMSKIEIMKIAREIQSSKITLLPGDDLCAYFASKSQTPKIRKIEEFETILSNPIYMKIVEEILKKDVTKSQI